MKREDSNKRKIYYSETGAGFREFIKRDLHSSRLSKEIYDRNERQPEYLAIWMWSNRFMEDLTGEEHIMIDGTPRSLTEAIVLQNALAFYGRHANIIFLDVVRDVVVKRLLDRGRGVAARADDADTEKINKRLDWFETDVAPAIEYFRNQPGHNFMHINGDQSIEKVHADILAGLKTE